MAQAVEAAPLDWMLERMLDWADLPAVVAGSDVTTYRELLDRVAAWSRRLDDAGIGQGRVVAIAGDFSAGTSAAMIALIQREAVIVPFAQGMRAHRAEFLETAEVEGLISFDGDGEPRVERREATASHQLYQKLRALRAPGLVIFTSGSTGKSKAAVHNFGALLDKFKFPRRQQMTLGFLLFDHIGGINTLFQALSSGGAIVTLQRRDPEEVCALVERHQIELLPPSPTFLNLLLLSEAHKRYDLSSLKWITYGTEVMPESTLARLREAFPNVRFKQAYGMSELGILRTQSRDDGSVWLKIGDAQTQVKVVDGIMWVRSPAAMLGYLNHPDPFDGDGWLNTGDAVEVDGEWLRVLGRKSELINVGGEKVFPAEVENVLTEIDNIRDAVVFGEPNKIMGNIVVARVNLVEPEAASSVTRRVRTACRGRLAPFKIPVKVLVEEQVLFGERFKKLRAQ